MGYRPEVLGRRRIYGIAYHIKEQATSPRGLKNNRKKPVAVTEKDCENLAPSSTIKKLQHEVEYLRQEIELLKKLLAGKPQKYRIHRSSALLAAMNDTGIRNRIRT